MAYILLVIAPVDIPVLLDRRRTALGMSRSELARRAHLGLRTVQRVLSGEDASAEFSTILAIADVLGATLRVEGEDPNMIRLRQARRKADKLTSMLQGTAALEAQALDTQSLDTIRQQMVRDLLAGASRNLWDDQ